MTASSTDAMMRTHLEPVMGTVVGFASPDPLPADGLAEAVGLLHEANRIFSTWDADSPISRLRFGRTTMEELDPAEAVPVAEVLERCQLARHLTGGTFDPWAMPGGVDPTGLVKGWAAGRALHPLIAAGAGKVMVNAGGNIAVAGHTDDGPWRVGIRHPAQPDAYSAIIEVTAAVATSGDYERPGQLIDPITGHTARVAASATVTGPDLDLADALATGLAVGGLPVLAAIDRLAGYDAYLITDDGRHFATPGMAFTPAAARPVSLAVSPGHQGFEGDSRAKMVYTQRPGVTTDRGQGVTVCSVNLAGSQRIT